MGKKVKKKHSNSKFFLLRKSFLFSKSRQSESVDIFHPFLTLRKVHKTSYFEKIHSFDYNKNTLERDKIMPTNVPPQYFETEKKRSSLGINPTYRPQRKIFKFLKRSIRIQT